MNKPKMKLYCYNSIDSTTIDKDINSFNKCNKSNNEIAYSEPIQFNINRAPDKGTIFVNPQNEGVAIVTIENDGYKINNAWIEFDSANPITILSLVGTKVNFNNFSNQVIFHIQQVNPSEQKGNINVRFYIEFEKIVG